MDHAFLILMGRRVGLAALVGLCSWQARAQVVFYTDEGLFDATFPGLDVEDFEGGLVFSPNVECPTPVAATYPHPNGVCFPTGALQPRILVGSLSGFFFNGMRLWQSGGSIPSQVVSVADASPSLGLLLYVPGGVEAIGFDLFSDIINPPVAMTVSVYGRDGNLLDSIAAEGAAGGIFLGVSSSEYIYRIEIHSDNQIEGVDNVKFDSGFIFQDGFESGNFTVWECDDYDGDGVTACGGDCDDLDPMIPDTFDVCGDGRDNDCSGIIDDCCDPLAQDCPATEGCYPILEIPAAFPPQSVCAPPAAQAGGQGEVCPFLNSCFEGYGCALVDFMNPSDLLCAFMCDADDDVPGCQDPGGPGAGFVCARLQEFYFEVSSEDSWGMCIPEDLTCGDAFCQPWESPGTCPADCS